MIQAVKLLEKKNYRLVVATNPLFPLKAVEQRIQWAGLSPTQFELITSFETMHSCKPNIAFYREVLDALGIEPQDALMVGNDAYEDLIAGNLGIHTYLVTNCLIQKDQTACEPDYEGSSSDFLRFTEKLPIVSDDEI
jgi:FMN phosphatase YigB (HAD superfamily)